LVSGDEKTNVCALPGPLGDVLPDLAVDPCFSTTAEVDEIGDSHGDRLAALRARMRA
jgi:hypothetical protein